MLIATVGDLITLALPTMILVGTLQEEFADHKGVVLDRPLKCLLREFIHVAIETLDGGKKAIRNVVV